MAPGIPSKRILSPVIFSALLFLTSSSVTAPSSDDHRTVEGHAEDGKVWGREGETPAWLEKHVAVDSNHKDQDQEQPQHRHESTGWRGGQDAVSSSSLTSPSSTSSPSSPSSLVCDVGGTSSYRYGQAAEAQVVGELCAVGEDTDAAIYAKEQVVVVESINKQVLEMLEDRPEVERVNFAAASDGAKVLASNVGAKRVGALLDDDSDTFMRNDCKDDDKWVVIELSQVAKVSLIELSQFELYSSRVNEFAVYGMHSHPRTLSGANTNGWHFLGKFQAAKKKGKQAFSIVDADGVEPDRWVRYLLIRFLSHHGAESVCAINEIGVFGVSAAEELEAQLAMAEDEEVEVEVEDGIAAGRAGMELDFVLDVGKRRDDGGDLGVGNGSGEGAGGMRGTGDVIGKQEGRGMDSADSNTTAGQLGEGGTRSSVEDTSVVRVDTEDTAAFNSSLHGRDRPPEALDSAGASALPLTCGAQGAAVLDEQLGGGEVCRTNVDAVSRSSAVDSGATPEPPGAPPTRSATSRDVGSPPAPNPSGPTSSSSPPSSSSPSSSSSSSSSSGLPDAQIPPQSKKGSNVYDTLVQELRGTKAQQKAIAKSFDNLARNFQALSDDLAVLTADSGLDAIRKMQERVATLEGRLVHVGKAASAHSSAAVGMLAAALGSIALQYLESNVEVQAHAKQKRVLPQMVRGLVVMNVAVAAALYLRYT
jgi:hypothetical protein